MISNNLFPKLVSAGLWEKDVRLSQFRDINYSSVYNIAEAQSVVGLVAVGLEHVVDIQVPKEEALQYASSAIQLEQRNTAMNCSFGL